MRLFLEGGLVGCGGVGHLECCELALELSDARLELAILI